MANNRKPRPNKKTMGRRPQRGLNDEEKIINSKKDSGCGSNDPSWYTQNSQLALDAGRLSFTWPLGAPIDLTGGRYSASAVDISIPGVMALTLIPSIGISKDNSSPINTAARNIYSFVRHANSGHANYDSPDLMLYLLAMDSLYSAYAYMARAYGVLSLYAQRNRYLPEMLVTAMGLDYSDFLGNLANFRYFINTCAVKIGSLCAPNSMPYYARHQWIYSGVYADSPDPKSQLYMYVPAGFWQYNETSGAGLLEFKALDPSGGMTFTDLQTLVNGMIAAVIESEDMNIMSGDILKAFGADGVMKISQITENYTVFPLYNEEVLMQFQNASTYSVQAGAALYNVTQDPTTGAILFNPPGNCSHWGSTINRILTARSENPDPDEVLVSTRLMTMGKAGSERKGTIGQSAKFDFDSVGSEIPSFCTYYYYTFDRAGARSVSHYEVEMITDPQTADDGVDGGIVSQFHRHPLVYQMPNSRVSDTNTDVTNVTLESVVGCFDNYTVIGAHELEKLHETSLLSMFNVPQMGAWGKS